MKKLLKFILPIVIAAALGTTGIFVFKDNTEYYVDTTYFQSTYAYKDDVDLSGLKIIETEKDEVKAEHQVEESMVTSCDSTNSVGEKTLVLTYDKEVFTVNFIVMYEIQFMSDDEVYDLQYVLKASEIKMPEEPKKSGYEFKGWSPEVPNVINDNMTFEAIFSDTPESIPNLGVYEATYGDTLESIKLPSNQYGSWKFVDELTTKVGNVGVNTFDVEFIPTNSELKVIKDTVQIAVGKKTLEFKNVVTTFDYDGEEHLPTYELEVEGINVVTMGTPGVEVGTYFIMYVIQDANYEGQWQGNFTIKASEINISFDLTDLSAELNSNDAYYSIQLGDAIPTDFLYTVTGIENPSLLQLKLNVEKVNHAGTYEVTLQVGNTSYKNIKINNKCYLVVEKTSLGAGLPTLTTQAIYGNKLSSVTFEDNNPNGYWAWENPDYLFDYAGEHTVNLVFTPYSSLDYEVEVVEVKLNVLKRTLTFSNIESIYTYDGQDHTIEYKLLDGDTEISGINVIGQIVETNAGSYETKLEVVEDNYDGSSAAYLTINKANPETNFDVVFENVVYGTMLKNIPNMPKGYTWKIDTTVLEKAGENKIDVIFTPEDIDNYNVISGQFTVNVVKKIVSIDSLDEYKFVYNGSVHALYDVFFSRQYEESELKFYNIDITDPNNKSVAPTEVVLMNAGTYTVYITLLENEEYATVVKAVNVIIETSGVTVPTNCTAVYGDLLSSVKLPEIKDENGNLIGSWIWENEDPNMTVGDAGERKHVAVFKTDNENYKADPVEVTIIVAKRNVIIKVEDADRIYDYDGTEHTIVYKVFDGENEIELNVTGNKSSVNACNLSVTLSVEEENYAGNLTTELVVKAINPEVEWPTLNAKVYTSLFALKPQLVKGMNFICQDVVFEEVGTFTFDAEFVQPDDVNNNYNKLSGMVTVVVTTTGASITGVEEKYEFAYGSEVVVNATPSHNESELVYTYSQNGEIVTEVKNVGVYDLTITLPATSRYDAVEITTLIEICQAEVEVNWNYQEAYEYNGSNLIVPTALILDVNGKYQQLVVSEINEKEFMNAGSYQFEASFNSEFIEASNYKLINTISKEVEISKFVIDLSKYTWNYTGPYVYDGKEHEVELLNVHTALNVVYKENSKVDAGDYEATVEFTYDETNYEVIGEVNSCKWSITTSAVAVTWTYENSYTFTGYELEMPKAYILDGSIELNVTVENDEEFRNAGTYTFVASIEGGNYALSNTRLPNITVEKAELEVVWAYETEYVYTGDVLAKPTAKVIDLLGSEIELIILSNNGIFKNAGEYTFNAIFLETYADKDNYELTNTVSNTVEVLKADYDLSDISWDYSSTFTYDGLEHKVQLVNVESGLTAKYEGNAATNAGEYTATVTFDYDKANYNEPTFDSLDWTIESKVVEVEWTYETEYVYTGSTLAAPTATYENVNGEVLSLFVKEINGKEFKNAGEYTFVANIADPTIANNYSLTESYIIVSIESTSLSFDKQLTAIYGDTLADVELPTSEFGTWSFVDELTTSVGNAGKNTFTVKFDSNSDNYESEEKEVVITVSKKSVVISVVQNTFTYDGSNKTIDVKVLDGTTELNINVLGNETAKNAGTYSTTLSINEANYVASVVEASLVIEKAEAVITNSLEVNNSDYDGSEVDLTKYFALNHNETEIVIEITVARTIQAMKDAGVYTIVVTATETDNYLAAEPVTVIYTVNQIDANLVYTKPTDGYTYNGSSISVNSYVSHDNTDNNATITYKYQLLDGETYVDVDSIVEAGTYKVTASIASTTNFKEDSITFEVVVEKGHFNVEELESINAIYGQQLNHFNFQNDSRGTWSWKKPNDYVGNVGENTHTAVLTPNDESMDIVEIEVKFIVSPKEIKFTLGQTTFDYDGNEHTVTYTLSETPEGVTVESTGTITATDYVAGGYEFGFEIAGNDNYTGSVTGKLIINQISAGVNAPTLNATYNETYEDIVLPENENGTWSFVANLSTSVGNAGTKTVVLKFTPNSSNYKTENINASLVVAKADYTPTAIPTTFDATYGDLLSTIKLPTTDENGTWRWDSNGTVGNAGTNSFTATFTHENGNYNIYKTTVTVNVAKADAVITNNLPSTLIYTGSELIEKYFTLNHSEGNLVFSVTGKGTSVVDAGTYTVVVSVAETANYNAESTDSITVVVGQATPATDFTATFTYTYGKVLSNSDLSVYNTSLGHYEWVNPVLLEVGENQAIAAKFIPNDPVNYTEVQGTFHVTIEKIVGTITVNDNQTFTYGDAIDLGATTNNIDQGSKVVVTGLELNVDGFVDAGTYTVTLIVAESAHYTKATATITVTIEKKEEAIELPETFEYGTTASDIVPTASEYGEFVVYDTNPNGTSSVSVSYNSNPSATVVKTQTIWVEFIPAEKYAHNYARFVKEIEITIVRKEITFENVVSSFVYDGNAHEVEYTLNGVVADEANPAVTGNKSVTNVIEGEVSVTLNIDTAYYYGSTTVTLKITPATPTTDFTTVYEAYWNTNLNDIILLPNYSWDSNLTLSTIGKEQEFAATYNSSTSSTYDPNYISVSGKFTVNVIKRVTIIDANQEDFENLTYIAGKTYKITASDNNGDNTVNPVIAVNDSTEYTIGNAGTYAVVITVAATDYYQSAELKFDIVIAKATPTTSFTNVLTGTYGQTLSNVVFPYSETGTYAWTNAETSLITGSHEYEATFTPNDAVNYKSVTASFTVDTAKAKASISANANYTFVYDGSVHTLTNVNPSHTESTIEYTYKIGETVYESLLNAGTYSVVITLPESTNYLEATTTATVLIDKAKVDIPSNLTATYGDTLANVALPTSTYGAWTYDDELTTSVGLAGNNTFGVAFTAYEQYKSNYYDFEANVTIVVSSFVTSVTANIPTNLKYDETVFEHTSWFTANHSLTDINISLELNGEVVQQVKNAGIYTIYVTMAEQPNKTTAFYGEYSVTVLQAEYIVSGVATGSDVVYGDALANSILSGGDSEGTWTWVSSTDSVGEAGSRTHTAKFTPTDKNYSPSSHLITINVAKRKITFSGISTNDTYGLYYESKYNGSVQKISYNFTGLVNGDTVDKVLVTGNTGLQYVGIQSFTLKVADNDANYYSDAIEVTFEIKVGIPTITLPTHPNVYQDRVTYEELLVGAEASDEGTFEYSLSDVKYPEGSTKAEEIIEVKVTFTPADKVNYESASGMMKVTLKAVAQNSGGIYFGRVEDAIRTTNSGTITILSGTNPVLKSTIEAERTIKDGVTLFIPYSTDCVMMGNAGTAYIYPDANGQEEPIGNLTRDYNFKYGDQFATNYPTRLRSTLTIAEGVVLINNGEIEIAGQLSGGAGDSNAAGHTSGLYSRIVLEDNSKIINNAVIYCYGYIEEQTLNNGSILEVSKTGILYEPFVLRDFAGGTVMSGLYYAIDDYHISAFDSFEFRNVTSIVKINYGGRLIGWANLYAGEQQNKTTVNMIGNDGQHVINLSTENSYITSKFDYDTEISKIDFYGGATTGSMSLTVIIAKYGITLGKFEISTEKVFFPISWRFNITLNKAEGQTEAVYTMNQRFKMLPGAKMTIEKGAKLVANEFSVYEQYEDKIQYDGATMAHLYQKESFNTKANHDASIKPAILTINGIMEVNNFAGKVYSNNNGAKFTINNSANLITYEAINISKGTSRGTLESQQEIGGKTELMMYNGTALELKVVQKGSYSYVNGGWKTQYKINYQNVIITEETEYDEETITNSNAVSLGVLESFELVNPYSSDSNFVFLGWYLDENCTKSVTKVNAIDFYDDITIYSKWQYSNAKKYEIKYIYNVGTGLLSENNQNYKTYEKIEGTYLTTNDLIVLPEEKVGYKFNGWSYNGVIVTEDILIEGDMTLVADYTRISYNLDVTLGTAGISSIVLTYTNSITNETQTLSASGTLTVFYYDTISLTGTTTGNALVKVFANGTNEFNATTSQFTFDKHLDYLTNTTFICEAYVTITANTSRAKMSLDLYCDGTEDATGSTTLNVKCGSQFTITFSSTAGAADDVSISGDVNSSSFTSPYTGIVGDANITMNIKYKSNGCFAEGTLITLSDGTTKKVEDLSFDDYVLGWDFEKGEYVSVPVLLPVYHGTYETNIVNLVFSDGSTIRMILEHGFFDMTLNQWVFITEDNYQDYLGHEFVSQDHTLSTYSNVKLIAAYVTTETVGVYGPVTAYTINCFAEGLLSMVPATGIKEGSLNGLFDYFEVGDNLQYDLELMNKDIETYGLYTYDDWKEYATEYEFEALNIKYLKVAVGKGLITEEDIKLAMQTYFPKV